MITDEMREFKNLIKYKVESLDVLFENGDIETVESGFITHLYIEKDYDNLFFPIINVSMAMEDSIYDRISKENDTVQFRLKIVKNIYDKDENFLKFESYCNKLFRCFINQENVIKDNRQVDEKKDTENESESSNYKGNVRNLYLFTEDIIKCKKIINLSIESANLSDVIIYLIGDCGIEKLLMTKLDNQCELSNVIIPNGNLIETISFLDDLKGFYKKGTMLFFDVDTTYLIDRNALCTSWRKNEVKITHIHVSNQSGGDSQLNGQYTDEDRKSNHVFTNNGRIDMIGGGVINDQLVGNKLTVINSKANSVVDVSTESTQIGEPNKRMLSTKINHQFTISNIQTTLEENECVCDIAFLGIDIDIFTPNKEVLITYEDPEFNKKYSGKYRITKVQALLKKDAEELVGEIQVTLKRQK